MLRTILCLLAALVCIPDARSIDSGMSHTSELLYSMVQPGKLLAFYPFDGTVDSMVPFER
jgi:hypothetical protein